MKTFEDKSRESNIAGLFNNFNVKGDVIVNKINRWFSD
jgi:hypothetical protein